jgi:hypothetical protein
MIRGYWTDTRYVPEPSVAKFEQELGKLLAQRPCDGCGKPLGSEPRRQKNQKHYHPGCDEEIAEKSDGTNKG